MLWSLKKIFIDQPIKNHFRIYNIRKIATGQGDDYTSGCLPDYPYFEKYYKLKVIYTVKDTFRIASIYNFAVTYPWDFLFF